MDTCVDQSEFPVVWHRALFLSDLHLGTISCRADLILRFLEHNSAEVIYLVGDIFDLWDPLITRWGPAQERIVEILRSRSEAGVRLVYLAGNHDRAMVQGRERTARTDLNVQPQAQATHDAADGRRYLVLHGDVCDGRILRLHFLTRMGSRIDSLLRLLDGGLRRLRVRFGPTGRGPVEVLLTAVNDLLYRGRQHERRLVDLARETDHHGVICGHFHIAALHEDFGLLYVNCGDWVDSFTAVAEGADGTLRILAVATAGSGALSTHRAAAG
jgi:UDP-2,3-diacylglucosamine pyrophosphatase LpxH